MARKKIGIWLGIVLVAGGAVLAFGYRSSSASSMPALQTVTVDEGEVSRRIVAHGTLRPVQTVTVGSQVSGNVDEIYVDFNTPVTRGQVLARIDPSTFEAAVRSAEAELAAAEANLELARLQYERMQALRENQVVPASEVDHATASLRQAEAQLTVRQHALESAIQELDRCTIYAPTDGMVIDRTVDVGQTVAASLSAPELFRIATDLSEMRIHAMISEADIGAVSEEQQVRFFVDAYRERELVGEVLQVRNSPTVESNVVHYETIITVDNPEGILRPGMTAEVAVITDEVPEAVRVRNTALRARIPDNLLPPEPVERSEDANGEVYRLEGDRIVAVPVVTGLQDELNTEIRAGLEPGDVLVVGLQVQTGQDQGGRGFFSGNQAQF
jgi:HlyD family secretion protein